MIKIIHRPDPLHPFVEIGDLETKLIINTVLSEDLTEYIADLKPFFQNKKIDKKIVKEIIDFSFIDRLTKKAEEFTSSLICSLKDKHIGDCTSTPCSCEKCFVEEILGIDTLKDFKDSTGKYPTHHILYNIQLASGVIKRKGIYSGSMLFLDQLIEYFDQDQEEKRAIHNLLIKYREKITFNDTIIQNN